MFLLCNLQSACSLHFTYTGYLPWAISSLNLESDYLRSAIYLLFPFYFNWQSTISTCPQSAIHLLMNSANICNLLAFCLNLQSSSDSTCKRNVSQNTAARIQLAARYLPVSPQYFYPVCKPFRLSFDHIWCHTSNNLVEAAYQLCRTC